MNRIEKYNVIKQEIDMWDPVYLYEMDCPPNEYDIEITKISSLFVGEVTEKALAHHIHDVFLEMFGENTRTKAEDMLNCQKIAQDILNKINK